MTVQSTFTKRYDKFIEALTTARMAQEILPHELGEMIGDKPGSYVTDYERGVKRIGIIEFLTICDLLKKEPLQLLRNQGII